MDVPRRIRIRREGGQIVQGCDIYIGRRCTMGGWLLSDSIWANPFTVKQYGREQCLLMYWEHLRSNLDLQRQLITLRGKTIGCFCELNEQCHGDLLIQAGRYLGYWGNSLV